MKLRILFWIIVILLLIQAPLLVSAIQGADFPLQFSTDPKDYIFYDTFNGSDSTTVRDAETGQVYTETGSSNWQILNNELHHSDTTGSARMCVDINTTERHGNVNITYELSFRTGDTETQYNFYTSGLSEGTACDSVTYSASYRMTVAEWQYNDGGGGFTAFDPVVTIVKGQNYTFRLVIRNGTMFYMNITTVRNNSGTIEYTELATVGFNKLDSTNIWKSWTFNRDWSGHSHRGLVDIFEAVVWNWTVEADAQKRPAPAVADAPCDYTSGDYKVTFGNQCDITTNIAAGSNICEITGDAGTFEVKSGAQLQCKEIHIIPDDFDGDSIFSILKGAVFSILK